MARSVSAKRRPTTSNNAFMIFLQHYREDCSQGKSQNRIAREAGEIWRNMTEAQKSPYTQEASKHRNDGTDCTSTNDINAVFGGCSDGTAAAALLNKKKKCNNTLGNMAHQLIECLLCQCEYGNYARGILFQFQQKANELLPELEDEQFYGYYKVLISALAGVCLLTVLLTLWHFFFP